jgi:tetratricopeptide (TPR) repeat protein
VVREVNGITAYQTGRWAEALAELRAARRLTGRGEHLALMADSERALGRPDRALELVHSDEAKRLPRAAQIELRIVESGIRRDQGLADAAVLALQVPELADGRLRPWSARLFYAYGDALLAAGRPEAAREAFSRAVVADEDEQTDALARLDELDGITVEDLEDIDDDQDDLEDDYDSEDENSEDDYDSEDEDGDDEDHLDEDEDEFAADDYPDDDDEDVGEGGEPDDLRKATDEDQEGPADRPEESADGTSEGNGSEPEVAADDSQPGKRLSRALTQLKTVGAAKGTRSVSRRVDPACPASARCRRRS